MTVVSRCCASMRVSFFFRRMLARRVAKRAMSTMAPPKDAPLMTPKFREKLFATSAAVAVAGVTLSVLATAAGCVFVSYKVCFTPITVVWGLGFVGLHFMTPQVTCRH
jgi:hypothetical protein